MTATLAQSTTQQLTLYDISWGIYEKLFYAFGDRTKLEFYQWLDSGYGLVEFTPAFPQLNATDLMPFIALAETSYDTTNFRQVRAWVRPNYLSL